MYEVICQKKSTGFDLQRFSEEFRKFLKETPAHGFNQIETLVASKLHRAFSRTTVNCCFRQAESEKKLIHC